MEYSHSAYRSPVTLSRLAMAGIGIDGLLGLADILLGAALLAFPEYGFTADDGSNLSIWLVSIGLISLAKFPIYVFAVVTFLMWLYRCYVNLPALKADSSEFTPGWAVGWWFVPLFNLVRPFQVVRSLWSESDPEFDPEFGFMSRVQAGAPGYMAFWWAAWLLSNFAANAAGRVFDPDDPAMLEVGSYVYMASGALTAVAALLAIKVIYQITQRQEQRSRSVGQLLETSPPPPPQFGGDEAVPDQQ